MATDCLPLHNREPHTRARRAIALVLICLVSLSFLSHSSTLADNDLPYVQRLNQGPLGERRMGGGGAHSYLVTLNRGEYLRVIVAQRGINVVVTLFAPDGKNIIVSDRAKMIEGRELVSTVAETSGDYRVEVRAWDENAATGTYEISIERHDATPEDKHMAAAERAFDAGDRRSREWWSESSLRAAVEKYEEAAALRRLAKDPCGEADTLVRLGAIKGRLNLYAEALEYFNRAYALDPSGHGCSEETDILTAIGTAHWGLGEPEKALKYYDEALALNRASGDRWKESWTLQMTGLHHFWSNAPQKALPYFSEALALAASLDAPQLEAGALFGMGLTYWSVGENEKALESYNKALPFWQAVEDKGWAAVTMDNMGLVYEAIGEHQKALDCYNQTLAFRRAAGQRSEEADTLTGMGKIYIAISEPYKALDLFNQALSLYEGVGNRAGQAYSLRNTGKAYAALGEPRKSLDYYKRALMLDRALGTPNEEAESLAGLARARGDLNNLKEARDNIESALRIIESLRDRLTSQQLSAAYFASKRGYYEFYIDLLMRMHRRDSSAGYDREALAASERARARSLLNLLAESRIDIRQGILPDLKQRERDLQARFSAIQTRLIQARSQAAKESEESDHLEKELKEAEDDRYRLEIEIRQRHPQYAEIHYPAPLRLEEVRPLLDDQSALLEYSLGEGSSYLFAVTKSDFLAVRLPAAPALLDRVQRLRAAIARRPIRTALATYLKQALELYHELIEPAERLISDKQKLIIAPDGGLHYLPFEVLLPEMGATPGELKSLHYLVRDHAISYVPSASVLASLKLYNEKRPDPQGMFLAYADPLYGKEAVEESALRGVFSEGKPWQLTRLDQSRREVAAIAELYPDHQVSLFLGDKAREEEVKAGQILSRYRYIHFAVHGLLNENNPSYSGLALSLPSESDEQKNDSSEKALPASAQHEDGLLQVFEIFSLKLNADLVVLSACETGLGKEVRGEGLIGLTRAFLYAGSQSVVVSLWKVADRSTAELMVRFYRHLKEEKSTKAEAMRQAQLEIIDEGRFAHPYYWAPFVLIGQP